MCLQSVFFLNDTATTDIHTYGPTLSLHVPFPSDREEDASAPISISGLPPAIGSAASDDSSDRDRRHEAGDGDDDRAGRPRGRGRPPRRQDAASSETGEARQAEEDRKSTRLNSSH